MKNKNIELLTIIISILLILSTFLSSVHIWCFNESFYESEHNKILLYGKHINEYIGISNEQLKELTSFTLDYLNDPNASLDLQMEVNGQIREVYTADEKIHMEDVRKLNLAASYISIASIILMVACGAIIIINEDKINIGYLYNNYKKVLLTTLSLFAFLGIWILIDFDSFWTFFHQIFFAGNELWLLDLRKDILIMIVPPEFFNHLVVRILLSFIVMIVFYFIIVHIVYKKEEKND